MQISSFDNGYIPTQNACSIRIVSADNIITALQPCKVTTTNRITDINKLQEVT